MQPIQQYFVEKAKRGQMDRDVALMMAAAYEPPAPPLVPENRHTTESPNDDRR